MPTLLKKAALVALCQCVVTLAFLVAGDGNRSGAAIGAAAMTGLGWLALQFVRPEAAASKP